MGFFEFSESAAVSEHLLARAGGTMLRALLLPIYLALFYLSLSKIPTTQPAFHFGFDSSQIRYAIPGMIISLVVAYAFVFARFSFGYLVSFFMFTIVAGFLWLNAFSVLSYDHVPAFFSAAAAIVLFMLPSMFIGASSFKQTVTLSHKVFEWFLIGIVCLSALILVTCSVNGFHFVGLEDMHNFRNSLTHSRLIEYVIGNINGALIPFTLACFIARRRWLLVAVVVIISILYYPVTLTKLSLFEPFWLIFVAVLTVFFELRTCVMLSLLVPLAIGMMAYFLGKFLGEERLVLFVFGTINFRMLAIPSSSLEHYFSFFSDHPLTYFCQISFLKSLMSCPYSKQLGVVFADWYNIGNINASLFATEGVASVGPLFMPVSALGCGFVIAFGNKLSAELPDRFVFLSAAIIPHILLNVPLSTTLLSNGLGLLFLLWFVTPRDYFKQLDEPLTQMTDLRFAKAS